MDTSAACPAHPLSPCRRRSSPIIYRSSCSCRLLRCGRLPAAYRACPHRPLWRAPLAHGCVHSPICRPPDRDAEPTRQIDAMVCTMSPNACVCLWSSNDACIRQITRYCSVSRGTLSSPMEFWTRSASWASCRHLPMGRSPWRSHSIYRHLYIDINVHMCFSPRTRVLASAVCDRVRTCPVRVLPFGPCVELSDQGFERALYSGGRSASESAPTGTDEIGALAYHIISSICLCPIFSPFSNCGGSY